jgi:Respiratory-chain NADH dehydrogenase, 49 Kd subunit
VATVERRPALAGARPYTGSRIPQPVPTILKPDPRLEDVLTVNFGPNHPSTHGVLRLIVDLHGEHVVGLAAVIGYLHTGFEKTMEHKTWWKNVTYPARVDYVSFQYNELVYVLAVEKLLQLQVPRKATWMRMALGELVRIHSHLVYLGTSALEIGAISMFWYCFRERDLVLDLFEMVAGTRMHTRYFQVGGLAEDIPVGFYDEARKFCEHMPKAIDDYESILNSNKIWLERTVGVGALSGEDAVALGQTGPNLRASGVDWDLRTREPYLASDQVDFDVPDHLPVPGPARGDAGRAVDRRRPQGRAPAARGAAHVDGVADPPLQDRDRGLPGPGGRGLRRDRVAARRVRRHARLGRDGEAVARQVPRPLVRRPPRDCRLLPGRCRRRPDRGRRLPRRRHGRRRPVSTAA